MFMRELYILLSVLVIGCLSSSVQLTSSNIKDVLGSNELVLVNFYADWCQFSQMLQPVFDEAAKQLRNQFPEGKVTLARVDCDVEVSIAAEYSVSKYPTVKLFRNGVVLKREYRGQRSVESFVHFVEEQLVDPIITVSDETDLSSKIDLQRRNMIAYFSNGSLSELTNFRKVASVLRDDCRFFMFLGPENTTNRIDFRAPKSEVNDQSLDFLLSDYQTVLQFATPRCIPLVREITFQNAEELTEEGLPFLILFHHPDDVQTVETYREVAASQLSDVKTLINILTADGTKFTHPLHHLGKTTADLPVLAIDSFRHMYQWPFNPKNDLRREGLLKQFVLDLHSGKLHREFHNGPDPADQTQNTDGNQGSSPPDSVFKKLGPSWNRYTLLRKRDEL